MRPGRKKVSAGNVKGELIVLPMALLGRKRRRLRARISPIESNNVLDFRCGLHKSSYRRHPQHLQAKLAAHLPYSSDHDDYSGLSPDGVSHSHLIELRLFFECPAGPLPAPSFAIRLCATPTADFFGGC